MGFHGDERAAPEIFIMLLQNQHDIFADVSRAHIIEAKLNHTWQRRLGLKKELRKIKVLSQYDASFSLAHRMISTSGALGGPSSRQWRAV